MKIFLIFLVLLFSVNFGVNSYGQKSMEDYLGVMDWIDAHVDKDPQRILDTLDVSIARARKDKNYEAQELILDKYCKIYYSQFNDYKRAIQSVYMVKDIYYQTKNKATYAHFLENMAVLNYESGADVEKAMRLFKESQAIYAALKDTKAKANSLNNFGIAYMNEGKLDDAIALFRKGVLVCKEKYETRLLPVLNRNLGVCYLMKEQIDTAQFYLENALKESKPTITLFDDVQSSTFLGIFHQEQKNYPEALRYLNWSKSHINDLRSFSQKARVYEGLYYTYKDMGDLKTALSCYELYNGYKDSTEKIQIAKHFVSNEYNLKINKLERKYNFEKKISESNRYATRLLFIIAILGLLVIMAVAYVIYNRFKLKKEQDELKITQVIEEKFVVENELSERENELQENQREVTTKSLYLLEKDNLINRVIKLLEAATDKLSRDDKPYIREVIHELSFNLNNKRWDEFEFHFNKVNPNFYKELSNEFPTLTANEKKLCAFLVMNMSTKEISMISGQTPHSINIARTRLRKKLNLTGESIEIQEFLMKFIK